MNDIIKRTESTELSEDFLNELADGLGQSRAATPTRGGGKPILKLAKRGVWTFGQADDEVQVGSDWAINPASIQHGWICWLEDPNATKAELLGELMVPVNRPIPVPPEPIRNSQWKAQRTMDMRCISGDDDGVEVVYKGTSGGGMEAVSLLFAQMQKHYAIKPIRYPSPIVQLDVTSYKHSIYGQIFKPVFEIVDWATMNGDRMSDEVPAVTQAQPQPAEQAQAKMQAATAKAPLPRGGAPLRQRPVRA